MIKRFAACFVFVFFILFFLLTLASNVLPTETVLKTFMLTINSKQVTVILPDELPDMDTAIFKYEACFNLTVCMQKFCLNARAPDHDHVDFVFTDDGEVIALVWIRTLESEYMAWKYVNGIPISATIQDIRDLVTKSRELKEVSGGLPI